MIQTLRENDILLGRGNGVAFFPGNINFRRVAWQYRDRYIKAVKPARRDLALELIGVLTDLEPPCRFLEPTEEGYCEVSKERVIEKVCQTLREKKFKDPDPHAPKRVIKSFHYLANFKKTKARRTKKPVVFKPEKEVVSKNVTQASKTKAPPTLVHDSEDEAPPSSPGVSRFHPVRVVTPDKKADRPTSKNVSFDQNDSLSCPVVEDDAGLTALCLKPRLLFPDEEVSDDEQPDVFGRTTSFLPKLELAQSERSPSALAQTLEDELYDPFSTDDFYPQFDPLANEQNDSTSFEVPPSLVSFFSDFSKRASSAFSMSRSDGSTMDLHDAKRDFHPIEENDEAILDWIESNDHFPKI